MFHRRAEAEATHACCDQRHNNSRSRSRSDNYRFFAHETSGMTVDCWTPHEWLTSLDRRPQCRRIAWISGAACPLSCSHAGH